MRMRGAACLQCADLPLTARAPDLSTARHRQLGIQS